MAALSPSTENMVVGVEFDGSKIPKTNMPVPAYFWSDVVSSASAESRLTCEVEDRSGPKYVRPMTCVILGAACEGRSIEDPAGCVLYSRTVVVYDIRRGHADKLVLGYSSGLRSWTLPYTTSVHGRNIARNAKDDNRSTPKVLRPSLKQLSDNDSNWR